MSDLPPSPSLSQYLESANLAQHCTESVQIKAQSNPYPLLILAPSYLQAAYHAERAGLSRRQFRYVSDPNHIQGLERGTRLHVVGSALDQRLRQVLQLAEQRNFEIIYGI